jgi:hypothetical protein
VGREGGPRYGRDLKDKSDSVFTIGQGKQNVRESGEHILPVPEQKRQEGTYSDPPYLSVLWAKKKADSRKCQLGKDLEHRIGAAGRGHVFGERLTSC